MFFSTCGILLREQTWFVCQLFITWRTRPKRQRHSVGTCLWHVSNALILSIAQKHAEGMSLRYNESYICPLKFVPAPLWLIFQKPTHLRNHQVINLLIFRRTLLRCFDTQFCGILADTFVVRCVGMTAWGNLVRWGLRWWSRRTWRAFGVGPCLILMPWLWCGISKHRPPARFAGRRESIALGRGASCRRR